MFWVDVLKTNSISQKVHSKEWKPGLMMLKGTRLRRSLTWVSSTRSLRVQIYTTTQNKSHEKDFFSPIPMDRPVSALDNSNIHLSLRGCTGAPSAIRVEHFRASTVYVWSVLYASHHMLQHVTTVKPGTVCLAIVQCWETQQSCCVLSRLQANRSWNQRTFGTTDVFWLHSSLMVESESQYCGQSKQSLHII